MHEVMGSPSASVPTSTGTSLDELPFHMQHGARYYIEEGVPPGEFLTAVLSNDLKESFGRADETNRAAMFDWCMWLYNDCPSTAQGLRELKLTLKA